MQPVNFLQKANRCAPRATGTVGPPYTKHSFKPSARSVNAHTPLLASLRAKRVAEIPPSRLPVLVGVELIERRVGLLLRAAPLRNVRDHLRA